MQTPTITPEIRKAASLYLDRQDRSAHPDGRPDKGGRWYPSDAETQSCCRSIRTPSRAWPWSLMVHCRTAEHVAHLCGVNVRELRRAARQMARGDMVAA